MQDIGADGGSGHKGEQICRRQPVDGGLGGVEELGGGAGDRGKGDPAPGSDNVQQDELG